MTRRLPALALSLVGAMIFSASPAAAEGPAIASAGVVPSDVATAPAAPIVMDIAGGILSALSSAQAALGTLGNQVATGLANAVVPAASSACGTTGSINKGSDGRLTVLLLGTDYRAHPYIGERTDTIIVATIKANGHIAAATIPRDTVFIPNAPSNGGGTSGINRVNTRYYHYRGSRLRARKVSCSALNKFKNDIAYTLQTEIDAYAMVRFVPFAALVNKMGGISVDVPGAIVDTFYGHGIYFPKLNNYKLQGNPRCHKKPFKCRSALAYARSRHGTQGGSANNDYKRAHRQHQVLLVRRVLSRGNGDNLKTLATAIQGAVFSNLPKTYGGAIQMYSLLQGTTLGFKDTVVFGPRKWAVSNHTTPRYTYRLKLDAVRSWINQHFGS